MPGKKKKKKNKSKQAGGAASVQPASAAAAVTATHADAQSAPTAHANSRASSASDSKQAASRPPNALTSGTDLKTTMKIDFKKEVNRSKMNPIYTALDNQNNKQVRVCV
jgi:hypothetical protein